MPRRAPRRPAAAALLLVVLGLLTGSAAAGAASLDLRDMTIAQLEAAVKGGRVSCHAVIQGELDRIAAFDAAGPRLNAVITVNAQALHDADALDARRVAGATLGAAHCVPVILKDNIETAEVRTTFGSPLFAGWTPAADAPTVARLRERGAVIVAKGNLDDFAAAVYGTSELAGAMPNPYDAARTVGGSSGGPAVGVAAGYAALGVGTDTGGSLRIPAAFTSVVTIRPTVGLVSRTGMSPRALTQDTPGPLGRTVADAATGLDLLAGPDPADSATARASRHIPPAGYAASAQGGRLDGTRIGVIRQGIALFGTTDPGVTTLETRAIAQLEALGATVVDLPQSFVDTLDRGFACNICLLDSGVIGFESRRDLTAFLAGLHPAGPVGSFDALYNGGVNTGRYSVHAKESFDREATVDLAAPATQADYATTLARQDALRDATLGEFADLDLDAVMYPSATRFPEVLEVEQAGVFTRWSEQTGFPAIGVPMGYGVPDSGAVAGPVPASLELLGRPWDEPGLIRIASAYEQAARVRVAPASTPATSVALTEPAVPVAAVPVSPPAPAPGSPARARLEALRIPLQRLATARAGGVLVSVRCSTTCRADVQLRITRRRADALGLRSVIVGRRTVTAGTTARQVHVRFSSTALRRLPRSGPLAVGVVTLVGGERRTTQPAGRLR